MKQQLRSLLNRHPRLKQSLKRLLRVVRPNAGVSSSYVAMNDAEVGHEAARLRGAWQDADLPQRQRELVDRQLEAFRRGEAVDVFDVMVKALRQLPDLPAGATVLEVGCSSGFYAEVLRIAQLDVRYTGCDYSEAFIALARQRHADVSFEVEDATALRHPDNAFDVVVSGCCLLHIPEYQTAVAETARVASHYAIFHRTPVVLGEPDRYFRKRAYGVETVEIHFNEPKFLALLAASGLTLIATLTLDETVHEGRGSATRTYVCRKVDA